MCANSARVRRRRSRMILRFPWRFRSTSASRRIALVSKVWDNTKAHSRNNGRLAQRERKCLTSTGSGVQIPQRPPTVQRVTVSWPAFSFNGNFSDFRFPMDFCRLFAESLPKCCQVFAKRRFVSAGKSCIFWDDLSAIRASLSHFRLQSADNAALFGKPPV